MATAFAAGIAVGILAAPPVPARQGKFRRSAITRQLPALTRIEPPELEPPQRIEEPPVPGLRLLARDLPRERYFGYSFMSAVGLSEPERVLLAHLFFRYASVEISADDARDHPTFARDGRIVEVVRDRIAERKAAARLFELGFENLSNQRPDGVPAELRNDFVLVDDEDGAGWIDVLYHECPLRVAGWEIDMTDFPIHLGSRGRRGFGGASRGYRIDWPARSRRAVRW